MKIYRLFVLLCLIITFSFGFNSGSKSPFSVKETLQGIELLENGHPVFDYQRKPKSLTGEYICNNYIHPLYSIDGDTLTEEFPADHIFHRGIFWAWHQLFIDNKSIGDGWIMKDISLDVFKLKTQIKDSTAQIDVDVNWKSSVWENGKPFVHEHTTILVHQLKAGIRAIDFEIALTALAPGVSIGGSDDEKGYGGFSTRIKLPVDLIFTSENGPVIPQNLAIKAGSWMDISGSFGSAKRKCGITLISLPGTQLKPTQWILRSSGSMQNIVFPGRQRIELSEGRPIVLKYRLIIHAGLSSGNSVRSQSQVYETTGVANNLPVFYQKMTARMDYKLSWFNSGQGDFETWRKKAREKVMECLMAPPPFIPFDPVVIDSEDRGTYIARKIIFNVTGYSRVLALMLVPKSPGPHPAVLLLHDHGAYFKLGKEKVIRPFNVSPETIDDANKFTKLCYGDRFIGDELAKRGYVCLAVDMLNWGDRQGGGYIGQQALASNFFNLGGSFAGLIAYEDMSAATFLSQQPEVDSTRIAAVGLSVGAFRTWQIAALSPCISAGVAVCWMSTRVALMSTGNNQTGGQSAFTCSHPGLAPYLDYPDIASIACPKPMMIINGNADDLFPLESITEAYAKMHKVWDSQNVSGKLVTKLYDAPHEFNLAMQNDAFAWLDIVLKNKSH